MKYLICLCLGLLLGLSHAEPKSYENFKIYKFDGEINSLLSLFEQFQHLSDSIIFDGTLKEAVVSPKHLASFEETLTKLDFTWTITVEDVSELISHERAARSTDEGYGWKKYYDLPEVHQYIRSIAEQYPDITKLVVTGYSYEGREILGLIISTDFNTEKPQAFIEGTAHAREWTSTASVTYLIHRLLTGNEDEILTLKNYFEWHIFPVVNPDGYIFSRKFDRFWRKNRSPSQGTCFGVDLNRNWDHGWDTQFNGSESNSYTDPCDYQTYGGPNAFSELETTAQSNYILTLSRLDLYFTIHASGGFMLIPFADRETRVANYDDQVQMCKTAFTYAAKVAGGEFDDAKCGATFDVYSPSRGNNIDWVRDATSVSVVYNIEHRRSSSGFLLWPASTLTIVGEEVVQTIIGTFVEARNLGYFQE